MAVQLNLEPNSPLEIKLEDNRRVIYPITRPEFKLEKLLEQITPENLHAEGGVTLPVGNEIW